MSKDRTRYVRLDAALDERLVDTAVEHGIPVSTVIRFAVRDFLARRSEGIEL